MNKKFINLLLASVLTVGSVQVFTSCKDNEADLRNEFSLQYESLEARVAANEAALAALPGQLDALKNQLTKDINDAKADLQKQLNQFNTKFENALKAQGEKIDNVSDDLAKYIIKTDAELVNLQTQITDNLKKITNLEANLEIVNDRLDALEAAQAILDGRVTTLEQLAAVLGDRVDILEGRVDKLEDRVDDLDLLAAALGVNVGELKTELDALTGKVDGINDKVDGINDVVTDQGARLVVVEGLLSQTKADLDQLTIDFNSYKDATDGRLNALEQFQTSWESALPEIQQNAADALAKAKANEASINAIKSSIETLKGEIENLKSADIEIKQEIEALKAMDALQQETIDDILEKLGGFVSTTDFEAAIAELKEEDAAIKKLAQENYTKAIGYTNLMVEQVLATMNTNLAGLLEKIEGLQGQINGQQGQINGQQGQIDGLQGQINGQQGQINGMQGQINGMQGQIDDLNDFKTGVNNQVEENKQAIETLQNSINETNTKIEKLSDALGIVTERVKEVADRITGIVLQGTKDEVFGTLRLPLGIQSNLLVSYFGEVANGSGKVTFPLVDQTASTYDGLPHNALTEQEAKDLGVSNEPGARVPIETISGLFMKEAADGNGYLGKVYATINPSSVNVQDPKFTYNLVNSRGQKVAEPMTFVPSNEMLAFGYSRADNGFYEAEASVKIDEGSINSIRFHFDDKLKTTVKDILKAPRASANLQTVAKLANAVYEQLNGFLPAIGVEATWKDSQNGDMKVTSNYGIATATVKPLSFGFLYGVTPGKHIPNIMPALDKIKDKFNVTFDELAGKIKIDLLPEDGFQIKNESGKPWIEIKDIHISFDNVQVQNPVIEITIKVDEKEYPQDPIPVDISEPIKNVIGQLESELDRQLGQITTQINSANDQLDSMIKQISTQVNDLLSSMQVEIDSTINEVLTDIKDRVNGALNSNTVNKIVNRLDGIINKLNNMMDNANYYLQPVLLYSANGDCGIVSTSETWPTVMVVNGNNNAVALMPTTYTYETVVPTFKKYVAVTKAWKNGDKDKLSCDAIALEANGNTDPYTNMNKVINSNVREVAMRLTKGYTYEVFYQAVDYSGVVSGRKYYICVK